MCMPSNLWHVPAVTSFKIIPTSPATRCSVQSAHRPASTYKTLQRSTTLHCSSMTMGANGGARTFIVVLHDPAHALDVLFHHLADDGALLRLWQAQLLLNMQQRSTSKGRPCQEFGRNSRAG